MVLMAALTTGAATPDCHFGHGGYGGCYGGGYGGHGGHGGWSGGYGGCYGCYGGYGWSSCFGCYGCFGCSGYGGYGGYGYGCYSAWGCHGCYGGGYGGYGGFGGYDGYPVMPGTPAAPDTKDKGGTLPLPKPGSGDETVRASLTVELPTDAKLFVDGQAMKTTAATRHFVTPPLPRGQAYFYDLRAEIVRDGQTVSVSRRVIVQPGQEARASFPELQSPPTATAQAGAK
jgi:uncharacterized protein (TIGR03000 family)